MKIKITCPCNSSFEFNQNFDAHPRVSCPNCGKILPSEAVSTLGNLVDDFRALTQRLSQEGQYSVKISHHPKS